MLEVTDLCKSFSSGVFKKRKIAAVKNVSFKISDGTAFGIVGNSGCGKSTIARMLLSLTPPDSGRILIDGDDILSANRKDHERTVRKIQIIFQHPESSMDPSKRIRTSLYEPMAIQRLYSKDERESRISYLLDLVGLDRNLLGRYPHQISGGEAQRIMIARALSLSPSILVLDEPTSMLDASVQAQIMNILKDLQDELGLSCLFISHDLEVVRWFCEDIAVMKNGAFVETGKTSEVLSNPHHEFTKELIDSFDFAPASKR